MSIRRSSLLWHQISASFRSSGFRSNFDVSALHCTDEINLVMRKSSRRLNYTGASTLVSLYLDDGDKCAWILLTIINEYFILVEDHVHTRQTGWILVSYRQGLQIAFKSQRKSGVSAARLHRLKVTKHSDGVEEKLIKNGLNLGKLGCLAESVLVSIRLNRNRVFLICADSVGSLKL